MEKKKVRQFYSYIAFLICFCVAIIGYTFVTGAIARYSEAQAVIAQAQPLIEVARGQRAIDTAVAFQTRAITVESFIQSFLPWIVILVYVILQFAKQGKTNEKIQADRTVNYTADN